MLQRSCIHATTLFCLLTLFRVAEGEIRPFNLLLEPAVRLPYMMMRLVVVVVGIHLFRVHKRSFAANASPLTGAPNIFQNSRISYTTWKDFFSHQDMLTFLHWNL
jgi:hypothetical protein